MDIGIAQVDSLISFLRTRFPGWTSFDHPDFAKAETEYKRKAAEKASRLLGEERLRHLIESGDADEFIHSLESVGRDTNLLWNSVPSSGDLSILYAPGLGRLTFCSAVLDLLYGPDTSPERLERYLRTVHSLGLPSKWTFPTYFLFVCHSQTEIFVKPKTMGQFLKLIEAPFELGSPSGETYARIRELAFDLQSVLAEYGPRDMIDVQSLIWVCDSVSREEDRLALSLRRWAELRDLFREFVETYATKPAGERHREAYLRTRADVEHRFAEIGAIASYDGEEAEQSLLKLFPDDNGSPEQADEMWAYPLPAYAKETKAWLERSRWIRSQDGQHASEALLRLVRRCVDQPDKVKTAINDFLRSEYGQGVRAGMISPILHALRPGDFLRIHAGSQRVINYFAGTHFGTHLGDFPDLNRTGLRLISVLKQEMAPLDTFGISLSDTFDMFCHWLTAEKRYAFSEQFHSIVAESPSPYQADNLPHAATTPPQINEPYPLTECAAQTGMPEEELQHWIHAIERKKQAILYGPPGTGKTFMAQQIAKHLVGGGNGFVEIVQFHPGYTYEDFIQGIRPQARPDGSLEYPTIPGRFLQFCAEARTRNGRCVLVIDEINRANLTHVFGELMYLLEYRECEIPLAGGGHLQIPSNVRIIGTMNTADRSIALVDHALRRRFAFLPLYPNYDVLRAYHQRTGFQVEGLVDTLAYLNQQIADRHYEVGVSFFLLENLPAHLESIWRTEIEPYLEEYFFDQPEKVEMFRWSTISLRVLT